MTDIRAALKQAMVDAARAAKSSGEYHEAFEYLLAVLAVDQQHKGAHVMFVETALSFLASAMLRSRFEFQLPDTLRDKFAGLGDGGFSAVMFRDWQVLLSDEQMKSLLLLSRKARGGEEAERTKQAIERELRDAAVTLESWLCEFACYLRVQWLFSGAMDSRVQPKRMERQRAYEGTILGLQSSLASAGDLVVFADKLTALCDFLLREGEMDENDNVILCLMEEISKLQRHVSVFDRRQ